MNRIAITLLALFASMGAPSCALAAPSRPTKANQAAPRPYPFWSVTTIARAGQGVEPLADGAAFPVAPGYFLISMYSMGAAAFDMGADPHVVIRDGDQEYAGEYVAVNNDDHLGLVRADFSPTAFTLSVSKGTLISGLTEAPGRTDSYVSEVRPPQMCVDVPVIDGAGNTRHALHGCRTDLDALVGLALLDQKFGLVALLSPSGRGDLHDGVDVTRIRKFLDTYFASGGRYVNPKPTY